MSIHITVVSDVSCPWCYVGKVRLDNALKQFAKMPVTYEYHPFIIDMGTKRDGEEYMAYNVRRWGGDGWTYSMRSTSKPDGCNFANWKYWPFSLHCHRLMVYANTVKKGNELMGIFYQMNYEEGKNLSVKEGLMEAATRCGLNLDEAERVIDSDMYCDVVKKEIRNWHQMNVSGVPFFIVDFPSGKTVTLEGAVSTSKWLSVLNKYQ